MGGAAETEMEERVRAARQPSAHADGRTPRASNESEGGAGKGLDATRL